MYALVIKHDKGNSPHVDIPMEKKNINLYSFIDYSGFHNHRSVLYGQESPFARNAMHHVLTKGQNSGVSRTEGLS